MPPSAHAALVISIIASAVGALVMCLLVARYGLTPAAGEDAHARAVLIRFGHALAGVCFAATAMMAIVALAAPRPAPPAEKSVVVQPDPEAHARLGSLAADLKAVAARVDQVEGRVSAVDSTARRLGDELSSVSVRTRQLERAAVPPPRRTASPEPAPKAAPPADVARERAARDAVKDVRVSERVASTPAPVTAEVPAPAPPPLVLPQPSEPVAAPRAIPAPRPSEAPRPLPPAARTPESVDAPRSLPTASRAPETSAGRAQPSTASSRAGQGAAAASKQDEDLGDKVRDDWKTIREGFASAGDDFKAAVRDLGRKLWR